MKKIVLVTGGFDPIHSGHIKLFNEASKLGSKLFIGINSDDWLIRKKKCFFMNINERSIIISNLKMVSEIITWNDNDDTAIGAINIVLEKIDKNQKMVFANGGDRNKKTTPELNYFRNDPRIEFSFGVGGYSKLNSSSNLLKNYQKRIL